MLMQKYLRSIDINLNNSENDRQVDTVRNINISIPESKRTKRKIITEKQTTRKIVSCYLFLAYEYLSFAYRSNKTSAEGKTKSKQKLNLFFKNNPKDTKNKLKELINFDFVDQSKKVTSWLESKIQTSRNFSLVNTFRKNAFSPLHSGNATNRKYKNPMSSTRSRNASLNSSKISEGSKPMSYKDKSCERRQIDRVFSPNPKQIRIMNPNLIRSFN